MYGHNSIVRYLIRYGADIFGTDNLPIKNAINFEYLDIIKTLLEEGVKVSDAINIATCYNKLDVIEYISGLNIEESSNYLDCCGEEIDECIICLENLKLRGVILPCHSTHTICNACITKMKASNYTSCPMCRQSDVIEIIDSNIR